MAKKMPMPGSTDAAREPDLPGRKRDWRRSFAKAVRRFLAIVLYLWAIFGLLLLHESLVLARYDIPFTRWGLGFISALVLGKVMLVMEELNVASRFKEGPLVYPIMVKSVVFALAFLLFYIAEEIVVGLVRGRTVLESIPSIGGGTPQGILVASVIMSFALIPYFAFRELGRAIGEDELRGLLFSRKAKQQRATE